MAHNVNRRPIYPEKDPRARSSWKKLWNGTKWGFYWFCFILVVASFIYICYAVPKNFYERHRINKDPVYMDARITEIGSIPRVGPIVYYSYTVDDSVYHSHGGWNRKKRKELIVGDRIPIKYERGNPSNSRIIIPR